MKMGFVFPLLFCSLFALAQTAELSNGYRLPNRTTKFRIIGKNNDGIVVRLYGAEDVIDVFDESLRMVTARTLDFKSETGTLQYIMLNKTGAVVFYLSQDKKYSVLLAQPVNSKFVEIGKPIVIDTIIDRKDLVAANLRFRSSFDQANLFIYYPYFSGGNIESIKFICVDRSLHALYNKTIPLNRKEKEIEESRSFIDNNGNGFFILRPESKGEPAKYDVFRISNSGDFALYSIVTQKAIFGEPWFEIDNKNGNLVMCAFYNDNSQGEDVANGFTYSSFDPANGTPLKTAYTPFSKEFITELTGRADNSDKGKLYTFTIRRVILRNDGGALILAESYIKENHEVPVSVGFQPGFNNYRSSTIYEYNDIIAFSVNPDAGLGWHAVMRKKQASEDDNGVYSSFLLMNEKDKLRFLYLDDISTSGILNQYILTSEGKSERSVILNQEDKEVMLLPKLGRQVSPNEVVMPSYLNGTFKLLKITY
jgi:hypothetical protein